MHEACTRRQLLGPLLQRCVLACAALPKLAESHHFPPVRQVNDVLTYTVQCQRTGRRGIDAAHVAAPTVHGHVSHKRTAGALRAYCVATSSVDCPVMPQCESSPVTLGMPLLTHDCLGPRALTGLASSRLRGGSSRGLEEWEPSGGSLHASRLQTDAQLHRRRGSAAAGATCR